MDYGCNPIHWITLFIKLTGYVSEMELERFRLLNQTTDLNRNAQITDRAYSIPEYDQVHGCFPDQPFISLVSKRLASDGIVHSPEHDKSITQLRE